MSDNAAPRLVRCPTCGTPSPFSPANRWRPFCSERCRSVDLGAWAAERFRVPAESPPDSPADAPPAAPDDHTPRH
ncbi:MAG: DNA gyrase inhibitor YacG [Betaproteobacteria bacterium]|nr:DNA gyrase inhibitor YacG [Betaproteobacteria bacterium]MCC6247159.1 DNA gyrase inhibitor YacG [Rubrivivax sp.]